jgi:hypothetical protein
LVAVTAVNPDWIVCKDCTVAEQNIATELNTLYTQSHNQLKEDQERILSTMHTDIKVFMGYLNPGATQEELNNFSKCLL